MCNYVCLPSAKYQPDFMGTAKKCLGTPLTVCTFARIRSSNESASGNTRSETGERRFSSRPQRRTRPHFLVLRSQTHYETCTRTQQLTIITCVVEGFRGVFCTFEAFFALWPRENWGAKKLKMLRTCRKAYGNAC